MFIKINCLHKKKKSNRLYNMEITNPSTESRFHNTHSLSELLFYIILYIRYRLCIESVCLSILTMQIS